MSYEAVVMGASSGGLEALGVVLPALPACFPGAILVVQHMLPTAGDYLPRALDARCALRVKQADEKESIRPGTVYIAPPNYHLLVEADRTLSLSTEARVNHSRPSIDVLFETAADTYGSALAGVIMTGANNDGSRGLKRIQDRGGHAIVQDPATAQMPRMPEEALKATRTDDVLPLEGIAPRLAELFEMEAP